MNWIKESESELRSYHKMQDATKNIFEQIRNLDYETTAIKAANFDEDRVSGGTNNRQDWLIDSFMKKDGLELQAEIAKAHIELVERGLAAVTTKERRLLELFFVDRPKNYIDILCDELGYEQSNLYYHKDIALRKFTLAVFGVVST